MDEHCGCFEENFSTLVVAVQAGELVDVFLRSHLQYSNDGFNNLPEGTLETLLKPENKGSTTIYTSVVAGKCGYDVVNNQR